jgi:hypothetical protein
MQLCMVLSFAAQRCLVIGPAVGFAVPVSPDGHDPSKVPGHRNMVSLAMAWHLSCVTSTLVVEIH